MLPLKGELSAKPTEGEVVAEAAKVAEAENSPPPALWATSPRRGRIWS
jgi:hypothetical protein